MKKLHNIIGWSSLLLLSASVVGCYNEDRVEKKNEPTYTLDKLVVETKSSVYKEKQADEEWNAVTSRVINKHSEPEIPPMDAWGGRTDKQAVVMAGAEGFFRLGKIGDRWMFIDPDGGALIIHGTQNVAPATTTQFTSRFATVEDWAKEASAFMQQTYLNNFDYGGVRAQYMEIPEEYREILLTPNEGAVKNSYNVQMSMLRSFMWDNGSKLGWAYDDNDNTHNRLNLIFEPLYETYLDTEVAKICAIFGDDPHVLGYQLDNELGFRGWNDRYGDQGILLNMFLKLPTASPAQQYAEAFVAELGLNRDDVLSVKNLSQIDSKGLREAFDEFRSRVAEKYYKMYYDVIKKYDSKHLIMGSRLHSLGMYDQQTLAACAKYCDVITINYYGAWTPDPEYMNNIRTWTGDTPFFITEFYVKGTDANYDGVGYNNLSGGGWVVPTQNDRADYYQNFCIGLIEAKNCVGWTHFAYSDVFTSTTDNNCNRGLLSAMYYPYPAFVDGVTRLNRCVYLLADYFDNQK